MQGESGHGIEARLGSQVRSLSEFQDGMNMLWQPRGYADITVHTGKSHEVRITEMKLPARPFAHEPSIRKRDEIVESGRDQRLLNRDFHRLPFSGRIALPYGLQSADGSVKAGHVLAKRTARLDRWAVEFAHRVRPSAQRIGNT